MQRSISKFIKYDIVLSNLGDLLLSYVHLFVLQSPLKPVLQKSTLPSLLGDAVTRVTLSCAACFLWGIIESLSGGGKQLSWSRRAWLMNLCLGPNVRASEEQSVYTHRGVKAYWYVSISKWRCSKVLMKWNSCSVPFPLCLSHSALMNLCAWLLSAAT